MLCWAASHIHCGFRAELSTVCHSGGLCARLSKSNVSRVDRQSLMRTLSGKRVTVVAPARPCRNFYLFIYPCDLEKLMAHLSGQSLVLKLIDVAKPAHTRLMLVGHQERIHLHLRHHARHTGCQVAIG